MSNKICKAEFFSEKCESKINNMQSDLTKLKIKVLALYFVFIFRGHSISTLVTRHKNVSVKCKTVFPGSCIKTEQIDT